MENGQLIAPDTAMPAATPTTPHWLPTRTQVVLIAIESRLNQKNFAVSPRTR